MRLTWSLCLLLVVALLPAAGQGPSTDFFCGLYGSQMARAVGDLVTVVITETTRATSSASRSHAKDLDTEVGPGTGVVDFIPLFGYGGTSDSSASNSNAKQESLTTTLTARVTEVTPAGNLVLEGERTLQVNGAPHRLKLRGEARPVDLSPDNFVNSRDLAGLTIEYEGSDPSSPGKRGGIINWLLNFLF